MYLEVSAGDSDVLKQNSLSVVHVVVGVVLATPNAAEPVHLARVEHVVVELKEKNRDVRC